MFRRVAAVATAAAMFLSLAALAVPAVARTEPVATATAAEPATAHAASPTCTVTPVLPRLIVADTRLVRRRFVLHSTCRLRAPAVFALTYRFMDVVSRSIVRWAGSKGTVRNGATVLWQRRSNTVVFGDYVLTPVSVHAVGGAAVTVRVAEVSIKVRTRATIVISAHGVGHTAAGVVTESDGYRTVGASRAVTLQWRHGSRWVTVRELDSAPDGRWDAVLPMTPRRTYRVVVQEVSFAAAAASLPKLCAHANRPGGGC